MKLYVVLVGCPEDQQEIQSLNYQLNLRVPAISLESLPYAHILHKINSSSQHQNSLFVIFSKYLKIDPYLNQVLNTITSLKVKAIFYPLAINNNYHSAGTWRQIIKTIELTRDKASKKITKLIVHFLENSDRTYKETMSSVYSKFINNQNVKFYKINKIQQLIGQSNQSNQNQSQHKRILLVSQRDFKKVAQTQSLLNSHKIQVLIFCNQRNNNLINCNQFENGEQIQRCLDSMIKNLPFSSQSVTSSKYSRFSVDSKESNSSLSNKKLSKVYSNKLIQSKIESNRSLFNVRLIILDNRQNKQFKLLYQKLSLSVSPTIITQFPSTLPNDKPTIILTCVENKSQVLRFHPSVDCIFFAHNPLNYQGMKNHNILITNNLEQIDQFLVTRGISIIKSHERSPNSKSTKTVKFADDLQIKNPTMISSSQSSLLNTDNSNIIKNLNKNKKKKEKEIEQIKQVINQYDIGNVGIRTNNTKQNNSQFFILPASSNLSSKPQVTSPQKPKKQLKIERTVNIHTNPRPISSASTTSLSNKLIKSSQSLISQTPTIPTVPLIPSSNKITYQNYSNQELSRAPTAKNYQRNQNPSPNHKNYNNFRSSDAKNEYRNQMLEANNNIKNNNFRPTSNSPVYSPQQYQNNRNTYYNSSRYPSPPFQITSPNSIKGTMNQMTHRPQSNNYNIQKTPASYSKDKSIIDGIMPFTQPQKHSGIVYKQKYTGSDKSKSHLFIIPQIKQSYCQNIKRISGITDDIIIYQTQKSLENIQFQNYKLAFVFAEDKPKYNIELCNYIPNLYLVKISNQNIGGHDNKQITVRNISELKDVIRKMEQFKPTYFSFCPKNVESVGSTFEQPRASNSDYFQSFNNKIIDNPILLFSSTFSKSILDAVNKKFKNEITVALYSNDYSLQSQLKTYNGRTAIIVAQGSLTPMIQKIINQNPNTYLLLFSKNSSSSKNNKYDPKIKLISSQAQLFDEIQFLTRI